MENLRTIDIICLFISYLLLGLVSYWLGLQSACDYNILEIQEITKSVEDESWKSPSENLSIAEVHSPAYLVELAKYESFIYEALLDLAQNQTQLFQPTLLVKIEEYIHKFSEDRKFIELKLDSTDVENQALDVSQNPLLCLNMIWRFSNELTEIAELISKQPYNSRVTHGVGKDFIRDLNAITKWPNQWALEKAFAAFLRIQTVYNLRVEELSTGRILGFEVARYMDVSLMFALGKFAREKGMFNLAVPWLDLAWDVLISHSQYENPMQDFNPKVNITDVEVHLMGTMIDHDKEHPGTEPEFWQHFLYRDKLLYENQTLVEMRYPMRDFDRTSFRRMNVSYTEYNYWSLCSGENHQTEKEKTELTCWYDRTSDPALTIFPIKKELLSKTPYIVQMYDFIGESDIKDIFEPMKPKMKRSRVIEHFEGASATEPVTESRTSVGTTLLDEPPKLLKLIEWTVGLNISQMNSSESYIVTSYAFGGHYDCHWDTLENDGPDEIDGANRIATVMLYLEDIQLGGLTAFPQAGVAAKPVKGSAVVWYNLKRDGTLDENTLHCACPVILNHKTISTKWILAKNQFLRRPCGLKQDQ